MLDQKIKIRLEDVSLFYGKNQSLFNINMKIPSKKVTAFIGPSGCGKSTLLRCFNRMNDLITNVSITGKIFLDDQDILNSKTNVIELRKNVGMVFQKPNPFPRSIYENVAYGLRIHNISRNKSEIDDRVEKALKDAALWDEVKNRLKENVNQLSGGQQQRLVIARAVAIEPNVILLDEPASALDPISTLKIEDLINQISQDYTVLIVTHNMQQAGRVSHYTAFMYMGDLIEFDQTKVLFTSPKQQKTQDYITGRYG